MSNGLNLSPKLEPAAGRRVVTAATAPVAPQRLVARNDYDEGSDFARPATPRAPGLFVPENRRQGGGTTRPGYTLYQRMFYFPKVGISKEVDCHALRLRESEHCEAGL